MSQRLSKFIIQEVRAISRRSIPPTTAIPRPPIPFTRHLATATTTTTTTTRPPPSAASTASTASTAGNTPPSSTTTTTTTTTTVTSDLDAAQSAAFLGEASDTSALDALRNAINPAPTVPLDATHSSYLGESSDNNHLESEANIHPSPPSPLDAAHAAFLGESDTNDFVAAEHEINPPAGLEALDAERSAFLGEGDSNDFVEAEDAVTPRQYERIDEESLGRSGILGQIGEGDWDADGIEAEEEGNRRRETK